MGLIRTVESLMEARWPGDYRNPVIKQADLEVLATEKAQIMKPEPRDWGPLPKPLDLELQCWSPEAAKRRFLRLCRLEGVR
jgi:hypothetical protein